MRSIDESLKESIANYKALTVKMVKLGARIEVLTPDEIQKQCASIKELQEAVVEHEGKLHEVIAFIGENMLENPLIGEYQRALDGAIQEAANIDTKARLRKSMLIQEYQKESLIDSSVESDSDSLLQ